MVVTANEGSTIRQATPPDVTTRPELKNYIWIKEGNPPSQHLFNHVTGLWSDTNPGLSVTKLDAVTPLPPTGSLTDGFSLSHTDPSATIYYSVNGGPYQVYAGGTVLKGTPDYVYVAAYAARSGYLNSDVVFAEYPGF